MSKVARDISASYRRDDAGGYAGRLCDARVIVSGQWASHSVHSDLGDRTRVRVWLWRPHSMSSECPPKRHAYAPAPRRGLHC